MSPPAPVQTTPPRPAPPNRSSSLRVAWFYDADACRTPTGVTRHALGQREALARRPDIDLVAVSGRITVPEGRAAWDSWTGHPRQTLPVRTRDALRLWRIAPGPPLTWWTGPVDWVYCPAEYLAPTGRARLAVTSHDVVFYLSEGRPRHRARLAMLFDRADRILSVSDWNTARIVEAFSNCAGKIARVPNAPDDLFFEPASEAERAAARADLGLPAGMPYLLSVANFQPRKNLERLVRAAGRLGEVTRGELAIVLIGTGAPEPTAALERAVAALPGRAVVRTPGYRQGPALRAAYAEATALVFPSFVESFGIPAVEAMAQGCPVALADSTALPEIAGDAGWFFDPHDDNALHATLRRLLDDHAGRSYRAGLGLLRAAEFTWDAACARLVAALNTG